MEHKVNPDRDQLIARIAKRQKRRLTKRQIEIVRGLALGKTRKQIALELGICEKTVDFHITGNGGISGLKCKLGFSDIARITHWTILNRIVKQGEPLRDVCLRRAKGDALRY